MLSIKKIILVAVCVPVFQIRSVQDKLYQMKEISISSMHLGAGEKDVQEQKNA